MALPRAVRVQLQIAGSAKADPAFACDDEMIMHGDAEPACCFRNLRGHRLVRIRRRRPPRGMIVDEEDGGCSHVETTFQHLSRINVNA